MLEETRIGIMKSSPENIYPKVCATSFPGVQSATLSKLNSLTGCWRSVAAAAQSSVSAEADGKHPCCCYSITGKCSWQVPICRWNILQEILGASLEAQTVSKGPTCNVGDLGFIPGLGRSPEEGMATHSSILVWRIPVDWGAWQVAVHWLTKS